MSERFSPGGEGTTVNEQHQLSHLQTNTVFRWVSLCTPVDSSRASRQTWLRRPPLFLSLHHTHSLLSLCPTGRLGLAAQDCHNCPQQVSLPTDFDAQRVLCGIDCSMIISTQYQILACGNNRYSICPLTAHNELLGKTGLSENPDFYNALIS